MWHTPTVKSSKNVVRMGVLLLLVLSMSYILNIPLHVILHQNFCIHPSDKQLLDNNKFIESNILIIFFEKIAPQNSRLNAMQTDY